MDKFPGRVEAEALGYELHSTIGSHRRVTYVKHIDNDRGRPTHVILWLTIEGFEKQTAELSSTYKGITIKEESFQWPNKNFALFERQVRHIAEAAQLVDEE